MAHGGARPCFGMAGPAWFVVSSQEQLHKMEKTRQRLAMEERCGDALATVSANSDEALSWRAVVETAGGPYLRTIRCSNLAEMVKLGKAKLPASCSEVEGDGELAQARWDNGRVVAPLRRFW